MGACMGLAALKIESEENMEERVARLEVSVAHIQMDVSELKAGQRQLDAKVDGVRDALTSFREETNSSLATLTEQTNGSLAALREQTNGSLAALREEMRVGRAVDKIWWLMIAAALLG